MPPRARSTSSRRRTAPSCASSSFRPTRAWRARTDGKDGFKSIGAGHAQDKASADPMMHKTSTVDYIIVLKGEIYAIMETGEKLLRAGDILVQRGTNHSWSVRGSEPCIVAAVLVSAKPWLLLRRRRNDASPPKRKRAQKKKTDWPRPVVGVIGLGAMGGAMSANLVKAGFEVRGYDVVAGKRAALKRAGGKPVASIARLKAPDHHHVAAERGRAACRRKSFEGKSHRR